MKRLQNEMLAFIDRWYVSNCFRLSGPWEFLQCVSVKEKGGSVFFPFRFGRNKHCEGRDGERKLSASSFSSLFCDRMIYVLEKSKPTLVMWYNASSCNVVVRFSALTVYLSFCHVVFHASFQICPPAPSCVDACDGCGLGSNSCCVWSWPFLMVLLFLQALSSWSTTCLRWAFQILWVAVASPII